MMKNNHMNKEFEYNDFSEGIENTINDDQQTNSSLSNNATPKKMSEIDSIENELNSSHKKLNIKKKFKDELVELKKIELEFAKEMDSARSNRSLTETRNKYEIPSLNKNKISLLELEILTETININSKSSDQKTLMEEIFKMIKKIESVQLAFEVKKVLLPVEYYRKWFLEYNRINNQINNANSEKLSFINDYNVKLNNENNKIIRSLIYYYLLLIEIYSKERKIFKKQYNSNLILKKDNIRLSHLMKSIEPEKSYQKNIELTKNNVISIQIYQDLNINKKVDILVGPDEEIQLDLLNNHLLKNLNSNKNDTLTNIDSINEISMLRTGRYQDAQNYREGILKITQEYNGLYDRTRNEYIERLLERQKNHDMEIKLMITSHKEDIDKMNEYFMQEKKKISEEHDRQLNEILQENKRKIDILKSDHSLELRLIQQKYKQIINDNNKEKDNSIQAFKIKFEHILIDMESNKDRELLNMKIEYEDKISELKEYYKSIVDDLELELQRKELLYEDEKKLIIEEFVSAHKREIELLRSQSVKQISQLNEYTNCDKDINSNSKDNDNENLQSNFIELSNDKKYCEIIKRLDDITNRSSTKLNKEYDKNSGINNNNNEKNYDTTNTTASSSAIPSNNVFINSRNI